jgi:hypothetical protein
VNTETSNLPLISIVVALNHLIPVGVVDKI